MLVSGATRIVFMIGSPVSQARSPLLFNSYFAENGLDRAVVPLEVRPDDLPAFFRTLRGAANCDGAILTLPHKRVAIGLVDEATPRAAALGSVNTVRRDPDGRLSGDMLDGPGFWNGAKQAGFDAAGKSVVLAGTGAAGTAIAHAFAEGGGRRIALVAQNTAEVDAIRRMLKPFPITVESGMPGQLAAFDMVINATPVGMAYQPGSLFPADLLATLPSSAFVADAITVPLETELLRDARALGLTTVDGNAMTAGQFELIGATLRVLA